MIPTDKSKNFFDDSIGSIHCIKLTKAELQRLVLDCPLPILSERGANNYSAPLWEKDYKAMVKSGKIGFDKPIWDGSEDADEV